MVHAAVLAFLALLFVPHVRAKAGVATQQRENAGRMCFLSLVVLEAAAPAIDAPKGADTAEATDGGEPAGMTQTYRDVRLCFAAGWGTHVEIGPLAITDIAVGLPMRPLPDDGDGDVEAEAEAEAAAEIAAPVSEVSRGDAGRKAQKARGASVCAAS